MFETASPCKGQGPSDSHSLFGAVVGAQTVRASVLMRKQRNRMIRKTTTMANKTMKVHPLCQMINSMAPLPKDQMAELVADIKTNGIKVPILVKGPTILDGLTRHRIAFDLKIEVPTEEFKGKDEDIEKEILS